SADSLLAPPYASAWTDFSSRMREKPGFHAPILCNTRLGSCRFALEPLIPRRPARLSQSGVRAACSKLPLFAGRRLHFPIHAAPPREITGSQLLQQDERSLPSRPECLISGTYSQWRISRLLGPLSRRCAKVSAREFRRGAKADVFIR